MYHSSSGSSYFTNCRSQISVMIWPRDRVHSQLHNIILINLLTEKPSEPLFSFALNCQIQVGRFFQDFVHFSEVKVANYCHHCPWKCITPHLRAHSIKETEGVINRQLLTLFHRKIPQKSQSAINISPSLFVLQTFLLLASNLERPHGSTGLRSLNVPTFTLSWFNLEYSIKLSCFLSIRFSWKMWQLKCVPQIRIY